MVSQCPLLLAQAIRRHEHMNYFSYCIISIISSYLLCLVHKHKTDSILKFFVIKNAFYALMDKIYIHYFFRKILIKNKKHYHDNTNNNRAGICQLIYQHLAHYGAGAYIKLKFVTLLVAQRHILCIICSLGGI